MLFFDKSLRLLHIMADALLWRREPQPMSKWKSEEAAELEQETANPLKLSQL